ncbi:antitoxin of toxin-antitoxin stability system [Companilactobacillus paralimentarius]|uniref:antitoxin of toxin-antitoxin stability system n=1 Tax=Companilactobacillus paralimentarius TaxID=83526 RepID=UPI00384F8B58
MVKNKDIKLKKFGHSTILAVPTSIKPDNDYNVFQGRDGAIVYVPKHSNPFKDEEIIEKYRNHYQREEIGEHLLGKEL